MNHLCKVLIALKGFTNEDNPFGDERLLDTFVWSKKLEKEGKKDLTNHELETMAKHKMIENKVRLAYSNIKNLVAF